jgi:biopolymer transport protein ExbD
MMNNMRERRRRETAELNITAFMNLMVILVPFLLITAVFSQVAILELNLPSSTDQLDTPEPETMQLEVIIREDRVEVGERSAGLLTQIPVTESGYDYAALATYLKQVKARFPDKIDATILLESDVSYDVLVQVMDVVRVYEAESGGEPVQAELFPQISIGDAPVLAREGQV